MKNKRKTVIAGASYFGIGYAAAHPDCLILDSSQILGGDFHAGARTAVPPNPDIQDACPELTALMKEYQAYKDGRFDVPKAAPVIHEYAARHKEINILLDARILSVTQTEAGYHVEYADNDGVHGIDCEKMLDTTTLRDTCPEGAVCLSKTLNLFTISLEAGFDQKVKNAVPGCIIEDGMNPGEKTVKIPFPPEEKLLRAYRAAAGLWKQAFPDGKEKILFIAQDFDYTCEEAVCESAPCPWICERFPNPLAAFAAGSAYQL